MKTMHLFAGAGGGLLADLILGHTPIAAVEWDAYCCQVLRERAPEWFPELRVHEGDIRMFDASEYAGRVDCIHAGFPCTDLSLAGNRAGLGEGTRSGLYREVLRIAGILRPRYLFLENVSAILSSGLGRVLGDLAALGYDCRWTCLPASATGAPHYRDRWWCLAERADADGERELQPEGCEPEQRGWAGDVCEDVADTDSHASRSRRTDYAKQSATWRDADRTSQPHDVANTDSRRRNSSEERQMEQSRGAEVIRASKDVADALRDGLQRLRNPISGNGTAGASARGEASRGASEEGGNWWSVEPGLDRVVDGLPNRAHRIKALGNAQVPLQAAVAWRLLGGP